MTPSRATNVVSILLLTAALAGCGREDVVLYASADSHIAREVVQAFELQTGLSVDLVLDTEAQKTTGLAQRLRAETDRPQADVFWSSEVFWMIRLADEGVLEPHASAVTADWPGAFRDAQDRWFGFAARARVLVYAPDRVGADELPETWMELTRERFKGRIVLADPRFGTTGGHLAVMKAYWDSRVAPGYYAAFLEGLAANEARLLPGGNAGVVQAVADGEADVGLTDTDDVWAAKARGLNVELVYPRHDLDDGPGTGTLLIPNTVARIKGGPNPDAAARLIDFLLSERVERMLAESISHNVPVRTGLSAEFPRYAVPRPLVVDYQRAAGLMPQAVQQAMRYFERDGGEG